jgi:hypothetical protein
VAVEQFLSLFGFDHAGERGVAAEVGVEARQADAEHCQQSDRRGGDHAVAAADDVGHAPPGTMGRVGPARSLVRNERPERPATEDQQQGGEQGERRKHRQSDPDRGNRPETARAVDLGGKHAEQREDHRHRAREDHRTRASEGHSHRIVAARVMAQLLPVSRDEQQRVVRPRAEHQHGEDPSGL